MYVARSYGGGKDGFESNKFELQSLTYRYCAEAFSSMQLRMFGIEDCWKLS